MRTEIGWAIADKDIGTALMRKAFDKASGPLSDMQQPEAEHEELAHLLAGVIGSYKNPILTVPFLTAMQLRPKKWWS